MYICTYILALGLIAAASSSLAFLDPSDPIQIDLHVHSVNETNLQSVLDQLLIWSSLNCFWPFANCSLLSVGCIYTAMCWGCSPLASYGSHPLLRLNILTSYDPDV